MQLKEVKQKSFDKMSYLVVEQSRPRHHFGADNQDKQMAAAGMMTVDSLLVHLQNKVLISKVIKSTFTTIKNQKSKQMSEKLKETKKK